MRTLPTPSLLLLVALGVAAASDQDQPFPFSIPWEPVAGTVVDSGALVAAPVRSRVRVAGDRLVDESGATVRLLGVNFSGPACFPDPAEAPAVARRLRWLGVNCVRLHHMDTAYVQPNLFGAAGGVAAELAPASLARLDALIAALAEQGIRVDLNLHVGRAYGPELGLDAAVAGPAAMGKAIGFFEPRAIEQQRRFAAALLDRVNPLRGMRLADDPVLAMVELVNEDGLVHHAAELAGLPAPSVELLRRGWNAFLLRRHGGSAALLAAWNREVRPLGPDLLMASGEGLGLQKEEFAPAAADLAVQADAGDGPGVRVTPRVGSPTGWHLQLHRRGVVLRPRQVYSWVFWARADRPRQLAISARLDHAPWSQAGLERSVEIGTEWRRHEVCFTANDQASPRCRLSWSFAGDMTPFALRGVALHEGGGAVALAVGRSLEAQDLPIGAVGADPSGRDWLDYLIDTEAGFVDAMRDYIHRDLRCAAGVVASQTYFGGLAGVARESRMDIADTHAYWQHPEFPGQSWSREGFTIANTPMSACGTPAASILHRAAASRPAGLPFTVTEYDHAAPSEYAADTVPLAYAIAARQDWSGLFLFQYLWSVDAQSRRSNIRGWFDNVQHPAKLAFLPIAAEMFLAGAIPPAAATAHLRIPAGEVAAYTAVSAGGSAFWGEILGDGAAVADLTAQRLGVSIGAWTRPALVLELPRDDRPVRWNAAEVIFDVPRLAGAVGRIRGRDIAAGPLRIQAEASPRDYAAVVLASRDGRVLAQSGRMLLAIIDKAENAGMSWRAERKAAEHPWDGEVLVTGVSAAIALRTSQRQLRVWALDGSGSRQAQVVATYEDGELRFRTAPTDRTVWYEVGQ